MNELLGEARTMDRGQPWEARFENGIPNCGRIIFSAVLDADLIAQWGLVSETLSTKCVADVSDIQRRPLAKAADCERLPGERKPRSMIDLIGERRFLHR